MAIAENVEETAKKVLYAGFWRRFLALVVDYNIVLVVLFPFFVALGFVIPDSVVVQDPYGLFSTSRTLDLETRKERNIDGSTTAIEVRHFERTNLGRWTYLYREEVRSNAGEVETKTRLLDPDTRLEIELLEIDDYAWVLLLVYLTLAESSRMRGSVGKLALGLRVVDHRGETPSLPVAIGRNAAKLLSFATLLIGFMMAGWTARNQAMHDKITGCYVIRV